MPLASIVIPCHNAARHLRDTLESAVSQTMRDVEIICVDNNSDDDTPDILSEFSHRDSRVRVIEEHEPGEGPARDAGRSIARGSWVYFLDSDDRMGPQLLEHACSRGEQTDADIVIFRTSYLDDQTGEVRPCPECFDISWISRWLSPGVFSPQDNPERIFTSFQNWVHNKVFRAEFIEQQSLAFQRVHRMADILFTCRALSEAKRIALLDEELHLYRTNNPQSALFSADAHPLDFYHAFLALRTSLEDHGTWKLYHDSFVNWAEEAVAMNLYRAKSFESFRAIVETMQSEGLARLDILDFADDKVLYPIRHACCTAIAHGDLAEIAFYYFLLERNHMNELETQLSRVRTSKTYRVGNMIANPLRRVRQLLTRNDDAEK